MLQSLLDLLHADDISRVEQDDFLERSVRFQVGDVVDVEPHCPFGADGVACVPDTGRTRGANSCSDTIDCLQGSGNQETTSWEFCCSSARDVGNKLGPPGQTMECSGVTMQRNVYTTTAG